MDFSGVRVVMDYFRQCFSLMPSDWHELLYIAFWLFATFSVLKVASWKEHS